MSTEENLDAAAVLQALRSRAAVLVDVREPMEFAAERIHGALNTPLSTFDPAALPKLKDQYFVFQCGSGKRSRMALDRYNAARAEPAAHLDGGIGAWKVAGLPIVRIDPASGRIIDPGVI